MWSCVLLSGAMRIIGMKPVLGSQVRGKAHHDTDDPSRDGVSPLPLLVMIVIWRDIGMSARTGGRCRGRSHLATVPDSA